jgi:hypothetical protein
VWLFCFGGHRSRDLWICRIKCVSLFTLFQNFCYILVFIRLFINCEVLTWVSHFSQFNFALWSHLASFGLILILSFAISLQNCGFKSYKHNWSSPTWKFSGVCSCSSTTRISQCAKLWAKLPLLHVHCGHSNFNPLQSKLSYLKKQ